MKIDKSRIGEISYNRYGTPMKIIKYENSHKVTIEFQDEYKYKKECYYRSFLIGKILNPYDKIYFNVGCLGEITASSHSKAYSVWRSMLKRCYSKIKDLRTQSYENCIVSDDWLIFKNFCDWYESNYYEVDNEKMCLDKDILIKGNKLYSSDTCMIVPYKINMLFAKCYGHRGEYPIGVSYVKDKNKFRISASDLIMNKPKCYFDTPEETFYVYKEAKENYIKQIADEYKDKIPLKLYEAMYKYVIEITD